MGAESPFDMGFRLGAALREILMRQAVLEAKVDLLLRERGVDPPTELPEDLNDVELRPGMDLT